MAGGLHHNDILIAQQAAKAGAEWKIATCGCGRPGSEFGSMHLFVVVVISRMSCEGGDTTIKYRQQFFHSRTSHEEQF